MVARISDYTPIMFNKRVFSLERANRSLPLVRRIVEDIRQAWGRAGDYQEQFEELEEHGDWQLAEQTIVALSRARQEYREFCRELEQLGCYLSDERAGAVDFPAIVGGRWVVLCWRLGESKISRWYDAGKEPSERYLGNELDRPNKQCYYANEGN